MAENKLDMNKGAISEQAQADMIRKERVSNNAWHKFVRNKSAVVGLCIITVMIIMGVFAPVLAPCDPNAFDMANAYAAPFTPGHLLGADDLGRDLLSRIIYGARV